MLRGQQKERLERKREVIHKISGRHNQGNTNMEIVCTPTDIVLRPVLTVDPIGSLLEYQEKENPNKQMREGNDCTRTPKLIFCKMVCQKTLGETHTKSKLPRLPNLDFLALIM